MAFGLGGIADAVSSGFDAVTGFAGDIFGSGDTLSDLATLAGGAATIAGAAQSFTQDTPDIELPSAPAQQAEQAAAAASKRQRRQAAARQSSGSTTLTSGLLTTEAPERGAQRFQSTLGG